jgi:hypothetical protein
MMLTPQSKVKPNPDVVSTELASGEMVLLNLGSGDYYTVNETGSVIWKLIGGGLSLGEVSGELETRYQVTSEGAWRSVLNLVNELETAKLVLPPD